MHLALRDQANQSTIAPSRPMRQPLPASLVQLNTSTQNNSSQRDEIYNMTITDRRSQAETMVRSIKKPMINRSCINTLNFSYQRLNKIPGELAEKSVVKFQHIQKLDLSFNNIVDIHGLKFQRLTSLKELILNDNQISQLPFTEINLCKGLKLINLNNNELYILPTLRRVSYIEARNNPFRLVTSELARLGQLQFAVFDWMDYLIQADNQSNQDRYQKYIQEFSKFKSEILDKVDYEKQQNMNYCDFHCFFTVKLEQQRQRKWLRTSFLSSLIVKSMYKNDTFFINYLRNFQNELNYSNMYHNNKLLLEQILQNNNDDVLELLRLKKQHCQQLEQEIFFKSLRLCCSYSKNDMFRYMIKIKKQKSIIMDVNKLILLVQDVLERYDKNKNSVRILIELISLYREVQDNKIKIKVPTQFHTKVYRSMSMALLDIKMHQQLSRSFQLDTGGCETDPLFFAMKSKNQELLSQFLEEDWDIFARNQNGNTCKFAYGSTQISRKMVWKKQKRLIKQFWRQTQGEPSSMIIKNNKRKHSNVFQTPKSHILEGQQADIAEQFSSLNRRPKSMIYSPQKFLRMSQSKSKCLVQDQVLPYLFIRAKEITNSSWSLDYSKKISRVDDFLKYLWLLKDYKNNSLMKRLELWRKIMERLDYLFENMENQTPLLQYQILHLRDYLRYAKEGDGISLIKMEKDRISISNGSFWCCKNIVYEDCQ